MVESDTARVSVLPVAGCKFPAVFLGKVALDVVGLGVGPPCLRVDSEETLLTLMDERTQLVRAAPGVTPEDESEEGAPVLELIEHSVLGKPLVDSFWMAPWDAGGTLGDRGRLWVTFWWTLLRSSIRLSCQPASVDGHGSRLIRSLGQLFVLNIDMGLTDALTQGHNPDMNMKIKTESPRLAITPGEWYSSDLLAMTSTGFRQMDDILHVIGAVKLDCSGFPHIDSTTVGCGAVELDDLNFRRTR